MLFYHISMELYEITETFVPKIPNHTMEEEDDVNPRVCLSTSIEGCLSSVPWGGINLCDNGEMYLGFSDDDETIYFRVYEFEIPMDEQYLVHPQELWEDGRVPDATYKEEYWLLRPIQPINTYVVALHDWQEEVRDLLSYEDVECLNNGAHYDDVWNGDITTVITDAQYTILEMPPNRLVPVTANMFDELVVNEPFLTIVDATPDDIENLQSFTTDVYDGWKSIYRGSTLVGLFLGEMLDEDTYNMRILDIIYEGAGYARELLNYLFQEYKLNKIVGFSIHSSASFWKHVGAVQLDGTLIPQCEDEREPDYIEWKGDFVLDRNSFYNYLNSN